MTPVLRDEAAPPDPAQLTPWQPRQRPGPLLLVLVLLAHVALLLGWHFELLPHARSPQAQTPQPALVWLNLATQAAPAARALPSSPPTAAHAATAPPRRAAEPAHIATTPPPVNSTATPVSPEPISATIHLPAPDAPASAASAARERLLDSAATRAAILQAARRPLLSERAANATDQAFVAKSEKLQQDVARTAKGDCLKGEFESGIFKGLLSLPFLAAAGAAGQCAR